MQNTTNYNLNLPEGNDIVNPLTQYNPNFSAIDAAMFANKEGSIGTATEVVTGTVHAVVRANLDAPMFRFTATGAWASGDTMTLDGSAVTVHMADGTAPGSGAYIIGAEVLAVVNGTLVTLLTSNGAVDPGVTSFNSRTGAVTPAASDYDASMIDYDNTSSGLVATDTQSAIDEVATKISHGLFELWANSDPLNPQTAGTINLYDFNQANIDALYFEGCFQNDEYYAPVVYAFDREILSSPGTRRFKDCAISTNQDKMYTAYRDATISLVGTTLSITLGGGHLVTNSAGVVGDQADNNYMIITRILGLIHNN